MGQPTASASGGQDHLAGPVGDLLVLVSLLLVVAGVIPVVAQSHDPEPGSRRSKNAQSAVREIDENYFADA